MSTKQTFEKIARNTWLAGLGSIESSIELLSKSIETAQEKSNQLYSEFLTRGEELHSKLNEAREDMETRSKRMLGQAPKNAQEVKLAKLSEKVDQLTLIVEQLTAAKQAAASKPVAKTSKPVTKANATAAKKPRAKASTSAKTPAKTASKKPTQAAKKAPSKAKKTTTSSKDNKVDGDE